MPVILHRSETLDILYMDEGPKADRLLITRSNIKHLPAFPHPSALEWLKGNWPK